MMTPRFSGEGVPPLARYIHDVVQGGETSQPVFVECEEAIPVAVAVFPGNKARIEYSLSDPGMINQGRGFWAPWDKGTVSEPSISEAPARVFAIRCIAIEGSAVWELRL